MFCRSVSWLICLSMVAAAATNYRDTKSFTGSYSEVTTYGSGTDNPDSSTTVPALDAKETTAVDLEPASVTSTPDAADSETTPAPTTQPHSNHSDDVTDALPTTFGSRPVNDTAVSILRSLPGEEKGRRLIEAAKEGAMEELKALLRAGVDLGVRDEFERTALHLAAAWGHAEAVLLLAAAGAEVDSRDRWNQTPLHLAADWGRPEVASWLLAAGAQVRARDIWKSTPLHYAAARGHTAVAQELLASRANPNARDKSGRTPLHDAAIHGSAEAAEELLSEGAFRDARDNDGKTPLDLARLNNQQRMIDVLI